MGGGRSRCALKTLTHRLPAITSPHWNCALRRVTGGRDRTRLLSLTSGASFQWMTPPSRLRITSSGATMPSLRQSYTVTGPGDPAAVPMNKRDLQRKNQAVSRSKLMSTFMGLIINQAKVSPPAEVGLHLLGFIMLLDISSVHHNLLCI